MPHPRQSAEAELNAAMLAVPGDNREQRQLHQFVDAPDSLALITESDESDNEEVAFD